MKKNVKTITVSIKLNEKDNERMQKMREDFDLNISSYIRKCLNKKYEELYKEEKDR